MNDATVINNASSASEFLPEQLVHKVHRAEYLDRKSGDVKGMSGFDSSDLDSVASSSTTKEYDLLVRLLIDQHSKLSNESEMNNEKDQHSKLSNECEMNNEKAPNARPKCHVCDKASLFLCFRIVSGVSDKVRPIILTTIDIRTILHP